MNLEVSKINFKGNPEKVCYDCIYRLNVINKKEGTSAALNFLVELINTNAFAANIAFRLFRDELNQEQQAVFMQAIHDYFDNFLSDYRSNLIAQSAIATATSLSLKEYEMTGKIMDHINRFMKARTVRRLYADKCRSFLATSYLNEEKMAAYFYYRYLCFESTDVENELYYYGREIRFLQNIPPMLIELVHRAVESGYYRYLCSFLKVFPDIMISNADLSYDDMSFVAGGDNSKIMYVIFVYLFVRNGRDQGSIDKWFRIVSSQFSEEEDENILRIIRFLYFCRSITRDNDTAGVIAKYNYQPITRTALNTIYVKDAIEDAFFHLLKYKPEYLDEFIERLGSNNIFLFDTAQEYKASSPLTFSTCRMFIEKMQNIGYTESHILNIYMNSRLRSCYPLSLFIRNLYFNSDEIRRGVTRKLDDFSQYIFSGRVVYSEESRRFRFVSYNYRNDLIEVYIGNSHSFRYLSGLEENNETVRFRINEAQYRTEKPGNIELLGDLLSNTGNEEIKIVRQYIAIKPDSTLQEELKEKSRSVDRMRYLYREYARQHISIEQLKSYLKRENRYVRKSLPYQINAQVEVFRSFRSLEVLPKRFLQAVRTLNHTSPLFSKESFLTESMIKQLINAENSAYHKDELIELYKRILARDLNENRRRDLYANTIMKYLIPYDKAYRLMAANGLANPRLKFNFSGKLLSHKIISDGRKMVLRVNHTVDPNEQIKVICFRHTRNIENDPEDGCYYIFAAAVFDTEKNTVVSRFLKKLVPLDEEADKD